MGNGSSASEAQCAALRRTLLGEIGIHPADRRLECRAVRGVPGDEHAQGAPVRALEVTRGSAITRPGDPHEVGRARI
jgi:hypothetical protein